MKGFLYKLPRNIIRIFAPKNIIWHLVAIASTYIIVISDFDWFWFVNIQGDSLGAILFPSVIIGAIVPILIPLGMLAIGHIRKSKSIYEGKKIINVAYAIGQAALLGSIISSLYKAFTGRVQPDFNNLIVDTSHNFQFGLWNHGIFWGWPSSHTTIAFAMAIALWMLFPRKKIMEVLVLIYALYIGFGVSIGIHWFSEFVAGAIIGSVIGVVVGKCFKERGVK